MPKRYCRAVDFSRTVKFSQVTPGDAHGLMVQTFPVQQIAEHPAR